MQEGFHCVIEDLRFGCSVSGATREQRFTVLSASPALLDLMYAYRDICREWQGVTEG